MSETKQQHTPGPWITVDLPAAANIAIAAMQSDERREIAIVRKTGDQNIITPRMRADAQVLAAAPELLEALEEAEAVIDNLLLHYRNMQPEDRRARQAKLERIRAAITKAKGRA